jgi:hypothetical protein
MKLLNTLGWLASFAFRRRRPHPESDFADMGTAFGLDASLMPDSAIDTASGYTSVPNDERRSFRHAV